MPIKRTFHAIQTAYRRMGWNLSGTGSSSSSRLSRGTSGKLRIRRIAPSYASGRRRTIIVVRKSGKESAEKQPTVPKLPPAGPAVVPKPLKPVPPQASAPPAPAIGGGVHRTGGSAGNGTTPISSAAIGGGKASSRHPYHAWFRLNGPVLLLNFGSLCTLFGFTRTDVLDLRLGNVVGNMCGMTYFMINRLAAPFAWASIFGLTNAYNIYLILEERSDRVVLSGEEMGLYEEHFLPHGVTPRQFVKLMAKADRVRVPKGRVLVRQGEELNSVSLVCHGRTRASVLGRHQTYASSLPGNYWRLRGGDAGAWVGEIAFLEAFWRRDQAKQKDRQLKRKRSAKADDCNGNKKETAGTSKLDRIGAPLFARISGRGKERVTGGAGAGGGDDRNHPPQDDDDDGSTSPALQQRKTAGMGGSLALQTITALDDCTLFRWTHDDLEEVMKTSTDMRAAMTRSMTAAVVGKVVNFTVSSGRKWTPDEQDRREQRQQQQQRAGWEDWLEEGKTQAGRATVTREDSVKGRKQQQQREALSIAAANQEHKQALQSRDRGNSSGNGNDNGNGNVTGAPRGTVTREDAIAAFREVLLSCA